MHMSSASPRGRIQGVGLDSLPLGRGKFARFFQVRRKGVGEITTFYKITDGNQADITGNYRFPKSLKVK